MDSLVEMIRASGVAASAVAIRLPGEPEMELEADRERLGVPVADSILAELRVVASELVRGGIHVEDLPDLLRW